MRKKTDGDKVLFDKISNVVAKEFGVLVEPNPKIRIPLVVDAFKATVCLSLLSGMRCSEISRLSGRTSKGGIYKTRDNGYQLLKTSPDFKEKYQKAKIEVLKII